MSLYSIARKVSNNDLMIIYCHLQLNYLVLWSAWVTSLQWASHNQHAFDRSQTPIIVILQRCRTCIFTGQL